jgi:hypothetical protein
MPRSLRVLALVGLLGVSGLGAQVTAAPRFAGRWRGVLENFPARAGAPRVEVEREIGAWPSADSTCGTFKTIYREGGVVRGEKSYRLCRGMGPDDLVVDEGDGVRLAARLLGGTLVSPFKYDSTVLVSTMWLRGDELVEEILTVADKPAGQGVVVLGARGIQRLTFRRVRR